MTAKAKEIIFEEEARNALRDGIDQLADVVAVTLGWPDLTDVANTFGYIVIAGAWTPPEIGFALDRRRRSRR